MFSAEPLFLQVLLECASLDGPFGNQTVPLEDPDDLGDASAGYLLTEPYGFLKDMGWDGSH